MYRVRRCDIRFVCLFAAMAPLESSTALLVAPRASFSNEANACFVYAMCQALLHSDPLVNALRCHVGTAECVANCSGCLLHKLEEESCWSGQVSSTKVLDPVLASQGLSRAVQHDVGEAFLVCILDAALISCFMVHHRGH